MAARKKTPPLARWCLFVGLLGALQLGGLGYVLGTVLRRGGGPADIGLVLLLAAVMLVQSIPSAGVAAWWMLRASALFRVRIPLLSAAGVVGGLFFVSPPIALAAAVTLAFASLFAWRIAALRRRWITAWIVLSLPCLALGAATLWFARGLL